MNADIVCSICGRKIENSAKVGRGRPRQYHDDCRKFSQLISWMEDTIPKVKPTKEKQKVLRGEIWRLANGFNK